MIALFLVFGVIAVLSWKAIFVWIRPKAYPQVERPWKAAPVYSDYATFQLATARWNSAKESFEKRETVRLVTLDAWASKGGTLSKIAFLIGIFLTFGASHFGAFVKACSRASRVG
jgi:hypothetical protein